MAFCYGMLNRVSRSFSMVIQQLSAELRLAVCVFYLVLRALDTVEDDMALSNDVKVPALKAFYKHCRDESFTMECGEKDYRELMAKYGHVVRAFKQLDPRYQAVIEDICRRMGEGMAEYAVKEGDVQTIEEYDEYCHYVAGLVGIGLSDLFTASELEGAEVAKRPELANSMGLFLQKTNIIRDYLEDIEEVPRPRMWWPREIWGGYVPAKGDGLEAFKLKELPGSANEASGDDHKKKFWMPTVDMCVT